MYIDIYIHTWFVVLIWVWWLWWFWWLNRVWRSAVICVESPENFRSLTFGSNGFVADWLLINVCRSPERGVENSRTSSDLQTSDQFVHLYIPVFVYTKLTGVFHNKSPWFEKKHPKRKVWKMVSEERPNAQSRALRVAKNPYHGI